MPPGHLTKNRFDYILRLVKLFTLLLSCFLGMHIEFVPDFSCLFQSEDYFIYMWAKYECAIHPSGSWLQFLVCLFFSYVAIAHVSGAALYGKVDLFHTISVCCSLGSQMSVHSKTFTRYVFRRKKVLCRRAFLLPFLIFFKRCGVRNMISCPVSKVAEAKSICSSIVLWLHQNWVC